MNKTARLVSALLAIAVATAAMSGCAGTKKAVETTVQQGIETTSAGTHNTVPANEAQGAVDAANNAIEQQTPPADLGQ